MPAFVFLDTQAYEAESFNLESTHFRALAKHLESGRLKLVITDITRIEIGKRIDERCREELASLSKMRNKAGVLRSANRIQEMGLFSELHLDDASARLYRAANAFLDANDTIVIAAMDLDAEPVFERYFAMKPPFAPGPKRKEFPDAFVVEALIDWTNQQVEDLFVVSADGLFRTACQEGERLHPVENLGCLLDRVASDDAALVLFLRDKMKAHADQIGNDAKEDFENLGFHVQDEWGDAEVTITNIRLQGEPNLIDISESQTTAELRFDADYEAHLSYDDSSTGTYDSEEGRQVFMDHVSEVVFRSAQLLVTVTAIFEGMDEDEFDIQDIELTEPSMGLGIPTSEMAEWPWK